MIFVFSRDLLNLGRYECLQFNGNHSRFQYQHYQISQEEKYLKNIWPIALIKKSLSKLDGILVFKIFQNISAKMFLLEDIVFSSAS